MDRISHTVPFGSPKSISPSPLAPCPQITSPGITRISSWNSGKSLINTTPSLLRRAGSSPTRRVAGAAKLSSPESKSLPADILIDDPSSPIVQLVGGVTCADGSPIFAPLPRLRRPALGSATHSLSRGETGMEPLIQQLLDSERRAADFQVETAVSKLKLSNAEVRAAAAEARATELEKQLEDAENRLSNAESKATNAFLKGGVHQMSPVEDVGLIHSLGGFDSMQFDQRIAKDILPEGTTYTTSSRSSAKVYRSQTTIDVLERAIDVAFEGLSTAVHTDSHEVLQRRKMDEVGLMRRRMETRFGGKWGCAIRKVMKKSIWAWNLSRKRRKHYLYFRIGVWDFVLWE